MKNPALFLCAESVETFSDFNSLNQHLTHTASSPRTALTIGVFDGIHLGHKELIRHTVNLAKNQNLKSVVVSFRDHPLAILAPPYAPKRLLSREIKRDLIAAMGVDFYIELPFTESLSKTEPEIFIKEMLVEKARAAHIVCGYDFSFGAKGKGNTRLLQSEGEKLGFEVTILGAVDKDGVLIKSTHIRDVLSRGKVEEATRCLSRPHTIRGVVVEGLRRGKQLGFPTANIAVEDNVMVPATGVYFCSVQIENSDRLHAAMINIGHSPTFAETRFTIEAHILDFEEEIYQKKITLKFLKRLRDEQKFQGIEELVNQLNLDKAESVKLAKAFGLS